VYIYVTVFKHFLVLPDVLFWIHKNIQKKEYILYGCNSWKEK